jgi:hypothetical protein
MSQKELKICTARKSRPNAIAHQMTDPIESFMSRPTLAEPVEQALSFSPYVWTEIVE